MGRATRDAWADAVGQIIFAVTGTNRIFEEALACVITASKEYVRELTLAAVQQAASEAKIGAKDVLNALSNDPRKKAYISHVREVAQTRAKERAELMRAPAG